MVTELADPIGEVGVVRHHRTAVAERAQVLPGVEAEAGQIAGRAHAPAPPGGEMGLGRVLDHRQTRGPPSVDEFEGDDRAEQVDRDHRRGAGRSRRGHRVRVDQQRFRVDVDHHRIGPHMDHGLRGRDERHRRHDDLVTGSHAEGPEGEGERIGAGSDTDGVFHTVGGGEVLLEGAARARPDEGAVGHGVLEGRPQLAEDRVVEPAQVLERHTRRRSRDAHRSTSTGRPPAPADRSIASSTRTTSSPCAPSVRGGTRVAQASPNAVTS